MKFKIINIARKRKNGKEISRCLFDPINVWSDCVRSGPFPVKRNGKLNRTNNTQQVTLDAKQLNVII